MKAPSAVVSRDGGRLRLELASRLVVDGDSGASGVLWRIGADAMGQQVDRVAGAEDRGHVGQDERGVGDVALASRDGHAAADVGGDFGSRSC